MIVVEYGSEAWALRTADKDLLDVFERRCLQIFWVPDGLTAFQTVGYKKSVVQSSRTKY